MIPDEGEDHLFESSIREREDPPQSRRPRGTVFDPKVVNPIVKRMTRVLSIQTSEESEDEADPIIFGDFGNSVSHAPPAVILPGKFKKVVDGVRKTGFKARRMNKFSGISTAFRVAESDFKDLFKVPDLDEDIKTYLRDNKGTSRREISAFVQNLESELAQFDRPIREATRLIAFQVLIANASALDRRLAADESVRDLSITLAAQSFKILAGASVCITKARRANVINGLKQNLVSDLTDNLRKVPLDSNPSSLFGGEFRKSSKKVAKIRLNEKTLAKVRVNRSFSRGPRPYSAPTNRPVRSAQPYSAVPSYARYYNNSQPTSRGASARRGSFKRRSDTQSFTNTRGRGRGQAPKRSKFSFGAGQSRF